MTTDAPGPVDLILLDGWKDLRPPVPRLFEPSPRPATLVVSDDRDLLPVAFLGHESALRNSTGSTGQTSAPR
ncbi:hypothetical protein GCM10023196_031600 [Actinoallomurus vinaceus]|uniref:Uncharacterized protein n=1 Tax=Actinoallomurus vinaceus TaxID=1080074 RepID=A0ABP8U7M9_9ACTN